MTIDITYYQRCTDTLERAYALLLESDPSSIDHNMYRSACIKEFEIILEQTGKLLRRQLKPYYHSPREVDKLNFKDVFRQAVLRGFMPPETAERWLVYRDNRNATAHDYGLRLANETITLLDDFIKDARNFTQIVKEHAAKG
jgi:nucleotidyltransferase substrate binding protein (TIGR01987 family)